MGERCQRCGGTKKMVAVSAKCSDLYREERLGTGKCYDGYVPEWIGPGGFGDYVEFVVCRHCGQMQGEWPESATGPNANPFKWGKCS